MFYRIGFCLASLVALPLLAQPTFLDQGAKWGALQRKDFYSRDQGSRIMPLPWMVALKQPTGVSFLADSLKRYGYLPNSGTPGDIPVGFTVASVGDDQVVGMTCSACHTRQIEVKGAQFRVDGGPAIVDFQRFLADLDTSVQAVLASDSAFAEFAASVLGPGAPPADSAALRKAVTDWQEPFHTLISLALPKEPWGVGRLDAVSMIFNRLTGLDIGTTPSRIIPGNIAVANAPVRYPFIWNAPIQDKTQWPGFADNGNDLLGLARNIGEVYGVFGVFRPRKTLVPGIIDYLRGNSTNFQGMDALEDSVNLIGPPKWPWPIDQTLAAKGADVFDRDMDGGSCASCHAIKTGAFRSILHKTWKTPIVDVGTDSREHQILARTVDTGVLAGALNPAGKPLPQTDTAFSVLAASVSNTILQHSLQVQPLSAQALSSRSQQTLDLTSTLAGAFRPKPASAVPQFAYESRVLEGIWAVAPYLHNGSVRSLAQLLKPAAQRDPTFLMGPEYDPDDVGIAASQPRLSTPMQTTDCSQRDSGNSRCGHEFGTKLSDDDKRALLEFLKTI